MNKQMVLNIQNHASAQTHIEHIEAAMFDLDET